jgi:hypothetical protein
MIVDLIEAGIKKPFKLNLCNRTKPVHRHPEGHPYDPRFCQWRIDHPAHTIFLLEPVCHAKDSTFLPHILAQDHDQIPPILGSARLIAPPYSI